MMVQVYVSLGSNIDARYHLCLCLGEMRAAFGAIDCSTIYQTAAIGFTGPPFMNAVVGFQTDWEQSALHQWLRELEDAHGRLRTGEKYNSRTLDADLLLYGDLVLPEQNLPHGDILKYPFVLFPLAELAPDIRHPVLRQGWGEIAKASALKTDGLQAVQLDCTSTEQSA